MVREDAAARRLSLPAIFPKRVRRSARQRSLPANAATPLDQILNGVLGTLGIGLGQADSWVSGVRCGGAVLVR